MEKRVVDSPLSQKHWMSKLIWPSTGGIVLLKHPPPELVQCDFFPKVNAVLKGTSFETVDTVNQKATETMNMLTENVCQNCFDQWRIRMERCRVKEGSILKRNMSKL